MRIGTCGVLRDAIEGTTEGSGRRGRVREGGRKAQGTFGGFVGFPCTTTREDDSAVGELLLSLVGYSSRPCESRGGTPGSSAWDQCRGEAAVGLRRSVTEAKDG